MTGTPSQDDLLRRVIGGDPAAPAELLAAAPTSDCASLLVAAALLSGEVTHLARARTLAATPRERQLAVLAETHLRGDAGLLDALARDHLAEHPDHLLAAWIAGRPL